jgi:threonine synthase
MMDACREMAQLEGIYAAPEGGATLSAAAKLVAQGKINRDETIVLLNTGSGYKYAEAWHAALAK